MILDDIISIITDEDLPIFYRCTLFRLLKSIIERSKSNE